MGKRLAPNSPQTRLIPEVGGGVELVLLVFGQTIDVCRVEVMVPREMGPDGHAADAGFRQADRLEPDANLIGVEAAQPLAGRSTVAGADFLGRQLRIEIDDMFVIRVLRQSFFSASSAWPPTSWLTRLMTSLSLAKTSSGTKLSSR